MPIYTVENDVGQKVKFEWTSPEPPTDTDMEEIFAQSKSLLTPTPAPSITPTLAPPTTPLDPATTPDVGVDMAGVIGDPMMSLAMPGEPVTPKGDVLRTIGKTLNLEQATDPFARLAARGITQAEGLLEQPDTKQFPALAKAELPTEEQKLEQAIPMPSKAEIVGGAMQIIPLFTPFGTVRSLSTNAASSFLGPATSRVFGTTTAGALGGYMVEAGEKIQKGEKPIPGMITLLGGVIPGTFGIVSETGRLIREKSPGLIIDSLIKPKAIRDLSYGRNPGRAVSEEKIISNSWDSLTKQIGLKRTKVGRTLENFATAIDDVAIDKGIKLQLSQTLNPLEQALSKAKETPRVNREVIKRLEDVILDLKGFDELTGQVTRQLDDITFKEAIKLKRLIGDITKFTGNASDDKIVNAALKKTWGLIKSEINGKALKTDTHLANKFFKLNEKYADLTSAEISAKYRSQIIQGHNLLTLTGKFGSIGSALIMFIASGGAVTPALITGASIGALDKALATPAVKTRFASWLARASRVEKMRLAQNAPNVAQALNRQFKELYPKDLLVLQIGLRTLSKISRDNPQLSLSVVPAEEPPPTKKRLSEALFPF